MTLSFGRGWMNIRRFNFFDIHTFRVLGVVEYVKEGLVFVTGTVPPETTAMR